MAVPGLARQRSTSNKRRANMPPAAPKGKDVALDLPFEPCAATASMLLISQGSDVLCLHHDTLALERRFSKHTDDIQLIAVDNVSETGAGRLVVTYDARKTAIVWDIFSGEQIARFASYEPLKVAAWMRNGNMAFGNGKGEVILFEPSTNEHVSARTIFDPITALAPSSDCKTYAIGYNNGSILLAALHPTFTILHTLTTSRAPSPITSLSWHASSSKQKSDMLATQTADGDLRVWTVSKPPTAEPPRVIRLLKRPDLTFSSGRTWISWSKNGRIIQFAENETCAWDVRTKHMTYDALPLIEGGVRAIAAYGPSGTVFTLGPEHTVQQYDVEAVQMVKNVRHVPAAVRLTPSEENTQLHYSTEESSEELLSPSVNTRQDLRPAEIARPDRSQMISPYSQLSGSTKPGRAKGKDILSPATDLTGTTFSAGVQPQYLKESVYQNAQSPISSRNNRKGSRLREEVIASPQEQPVNDLFPFTRARLSDVPYRPPRLVDDSRMTPDTLRRQMLSVVFGWEEDIRDLIRDELIRHPAESKNSILLSKWLDEDPDFLAGLMSAKSLPSGSDWMLLALGTISDQTSAKKVTQVFIEKMLGSGDVHAAATLLLAVGDRSDAIEVYVSRNQYLEAVLLTCLLTPQDWQRQSHLVRKWGEHVVENSQQQLAIRCFSCTGVEPMDPWTSPTAQMATRPIEQSLSPAVHSRAPAPIQAQPQPPDYPDIYQKTLQRRRTVEAPTPVAMPAPPIPFRAVSGQGSRVTPQTSALKLITSFGGKATAFKFPGLKSDDHTPTHGAAVTPIAESAIDRSALSPGGAGSYRLNNMRSINSAMAARVGTPTSYHRSRLPSIGETPIDVEMPSFPATLASRSLPTPVDSGSEKEKEQAEHAAQADRHKHTQPTLTLSSARYEPGSARVQDSPQTALGPQSQISYPMDSRSLEMELGAESRPSTGSRSRKPDGLSIQMIPVNEGDEDRASSQGPYTTDSFQTTTIDAMSGTASPPNTGEMKRSVKSPSVSGRSLDQYLSSLEQAQYYNHQLRPQGNSNSSRPSRDGQSEKRSRHRNQGRSEELRGRDDRRTIPPTKRSPSSPVPMSPEDIRLFSASVESFDSLYLSNTSGMERANTPGSQSKLGRQRSHSTKDGKHRQRSSSRHTDGKSKPSSGTVSRRTSPNPSRTGHKSRGRSSSRKEASGRRSPSSPLPMVPSEEDRQGQPDSALRYVSADRKRTHRSTSRRPSRETSAHRDPSPDGRWHRTRSQSRQAEEREGGLSRKSSVGTRSERSRSKRHRQASDKVEALYGLLQNQQSRATPPPIDIDQTPTAHYPPTAIDRRKKELAAAELEARRLSLARRPSVPNIPLPGQGLHNKSASTGHTPPLVSASTENILSSSRYADPSTDGYQFPDPTSRRPGTPRAMQVTPENRGGDDDPGELLPGSVYQTPKSDAGFSPRPPQYSEFDSVAPLPTHPAFDARIAGSRSSSKGRDGPKSRAASRERGVFSSRDSPPMMIGSFGQVPGITGVGSPPILPELQHLANPPPPPPPPPPPVLKDLPKLKLRIEEDTAAGVPLPLSARPPMTDSANPNGYHRRGRSGNEPSQFIDKIRSFAGRVRSTSRENDNAMRSPHPGYEEMPPMPYETTVPLSSHSMQSIANPSHF